MDVTGRSNDDQRGLGHLNRSMAANRNPDSVRHLRGVTDEALGVTVLDPTAQTTIEAHLVAPAADLDGRQAGRTLIDRHLDIGPVLGDDHHAGHRILDLDLLGTGRRGQGGRGRQSAERDCGMSQLEHDVTSGQEKRCPDRATAGVRSHFKSRS
jgi:hypothetical protein